MSCSTLCDSRMPRSSGSRAMFIAMSYHAASVAVVDRHRPHRRMGKMNRSAGRPAGLSRTSHESPTVGAEAVHPDDGALGIGAGREFNVGQQFQLSSWVREPRIWAGRP